MHYLLILSLFVCIVQAVPVRFDEILVPGRWPADKSRTPADLSGFKSQYAHKNSLLTRTDANRIITAAVDECDNFIHDGTFPNVYYNLASLHNGGPVRFGIDEETDQESYPALEHFGAVLDQTLKRKWSFEKLSWSELNAEWKQVQRSSIHEIGKKIGNFRMAYDGPLCKESVFYWKGP